MWRRRKSTLERVYFSETSLFLLVVSLLLSLPAASMILRSVFAENSRPSSFAVVRPSLTWISAESAEWSRSSKSVICFANLAASSWHAFLFMIGLVGERPKRLFQKANLVAGVIASFSSHFLKDL